MNDLVEEMLSQAPVLITHAELAEYKRRAQELLTKARLDELNKFNEYLKGYERIKTLTTQLKKGE